MSHLAAIELYSELDATASLDPLYLLIDSALRCVGEIGGFGILGRRRKGVRNYWRRSLIDLILMSLVLDAVMQEMPGPRD